MDDEADGADALDDVPLAARAAQEHVLSALAHHRARTQALQVQPLGPWPAACRNTQHARHARPFMRPPRRACRLPHTHTQGADPSLQFADLVAACHMRQQWAPAAMPGHVRGGARHTTGHQAPQPARLAAQRWPLLLCACLHASRPGVLGTRRVVPPLICHAAPIACVPAGIQPGDMFWHHGEVALVGLHARAGLHDLDCAWVCALRCAGSCMCAVRARCSGACHLALLPVSPGTGACVCT